MDIAWRPVTHDDVPAWNELLAAAERVDDTGEHYDEADLHEELDDPATGIDDRLGGWREDRLVAFAGVRPRESVTDYWRVDAEGVVHPELRGRGLGGHGLGWIVDRAAALQAERHPGAEVRVHVNGSLANPDQLTLLEDGGFTAVNWSATMRTMLDADTVAAIAPPRWPSGVHLETYDVGRSAATREAHNSAFLDHWGFTPWTETMWKQWVDETKNSCHSLSWVVVLDDDPDTVVGYCLTSEFEAFQQVTGRREAYLAKIGVRREHRGKGIASSLLRHALTAYAAAGFDESSLDVDTNNPTGAFGLYERAGYQVDRRTATYERTLPPRD